MGAEVKRIQDTGESGMTLGQPSGHVWQKLGQEAWEKLITMMVGVNQTEKRDAQRAGKTLFLGVSVRILPKEMGIYVGELNKAEGPPQCEWASR